MRSWNGSADPAVELAQLKEALETQPVIEQAKGMVMLVEACTSEQAFAILREVSQHANVKVNDVAAIVVAAGSRAGHPGQLENADKHIVTAVLAEIRRRVPGTALGRSRDGRAAIDAPQGPRSPRESVVLQGSAVAREADCLTSRNCSHYPHGEAIHARASPFR
ncbi:ANTAR domain-containing protein [Amycolatopsis mediterranei]|uniref:ANTAR domain-containing protein n=1 Tax=Amycolatopsis mediterranei TaxID=33910 RepID=UPI00342E4279